MKKHVLLLNASEEHGGARANASAEKAIDGYVRGRLVPDTTRFVAERLNTALAAEYGGAAEDGSG